LVDDPEIRRAAAKTLKGFCLTYLPHHFPLDPSDFFDEMCQAREDHALNRVEMIGFRGCAKSTLASLALPLWAAARGSATKRRPNPPARPPVDVDDRALSSMVEDGSTIADYSGLLAVLLAGPDAETAYGMHRLVLEISVSVGSLRRLRDDAAKAVERLSSP
jgi:hypothetical protein